MNDALLATAVTPNRRPGAFNPIERVTPPKYPVPVTHPQRRAVSLSGGRHGGWVRTSAISLTFEVAGFSGPAAWVRNEPLEE
jgi:hypothetical protein